jgi:hypothetical protein
MKAGNSVPRRARKACQVARHGTGQRARDAARTVASWAGSQDTTELCGTVLAGTGLGLLVLTALPPWRSAPWWAVAEFGAFCAAGLACRAVARRRGRRG